MSKCESCRKGYNGRNGNGYMPCGCDKGARRKEVQPPALINEPENAETGNVRRPSNRKNILNLNISLKLLE